jgi:hypothetical protein
MPDVYHATSFGELTFCAFVAWEPLTKNAGFATSYTTYSMSELAHKDFPSRGLQHSEYITKNGCDFSCGNRSILPFPFLPENSDDWHPLSPYAINSAT